MRRWCAPSAPFGAIPPRRKERPTSTDRADLLAGLRFTGLDDVAHRLAFIEQPTVSEIVALMRAREWRIRNEGYERGLADGRAEDGGTWPKRLWQWLFG